MTMRAPYFVKCKGCGRDHIIEGVDSERYARWRNGELIQRVFPELTPDERELMISGICSTCWEDLF